MARATHNFEHGVPAGQTVSVANSSGGVETTFNAVSIGTNATLTYEATGGILPLFSRGTRGLAFSTAATSALSYVEYSTQIGTQTEIYGRCKLRLTGSSIGSPLRIVRIRDGLKLAAALSINATTLKVALIDAANVTQATSTTALPLNQAIRLEWHVSAAGGGLVECKIFLSEDSISEDELLSFTGFSVGTTFNAYQVGVCTGIPNQPITYADEIGWDTAGWLGPALQSFTAPAADQVFVLAAPQVLLTNPGAGVGFIAGNQTMGLTSSTPPLRMTQPFTPGGSIGAFLSGAPFISLGAEMTSFTTAQNTNGNADVMATHYRHVFGSGSKSYPMGLPTISGGLTFAKRLTNRGVNAGNYRNGSYVSQSGGPTDWNWQEWQDMELNHPLSIHTYWPGNYGRLTDNNAATAGTLNANVGGAAGTATIQVRANTALAPARSELSAAINSAVTSITLKDRSFPNLGLTFTGSELDDFPKLPAGAGSFTIKVDLEEMTVTLRSAVDGSGPVFTVTRGVNGTVAASHLINATVWLENVPASIWDPAYNRPTWPYVPSRGSVAGPSITLPSANSHDFVSWVRIDNELLKVTAVSDLGSGVVQLNVARGLWATTPVAHTAGARVYSPVYIGAVNAAPGDAALAGNPKVNDVNSNLRYALKVNTVGAQDYIRDRTLATLDSDAVFQGGNLVHWDVSSNNMYNHADAWGHTLVGWDDQGVTKLTFTVWNTWQKQKFAALRAAFPAPPTGPNLGVYFYANNIDRPGDVALTTDLLANDSLNGAYLENWLLSGSGPVSPGQWITELNYAITLLAQNLPALFWPRWNKANDSQQQRRFCYGSLLLLNPVGKSCQFICTMASPTAPDEVFRWNLGIAQGAQPTNISQLNIPGTGLYQRAYTNGLVIVNPSAAPVTRALGGTYYDVTSDTGGNPSAVTSVDIPAGGAAFLMQPVGALQPQVLVASTPPLVVTPVNPPTDLVFVPDPAIMVLAAATPAVKQVLGFTSLDVDGLNTAIMVLKASTPQAGGGLQPFQGTATMVLAASQATLLAGGQTIPFEANPVRMTLRAKMAGRTPKGGAALQIVDHQDASSTISEKEDASS